MARGNDLPDQQVKTFTVTARACRQFDGDRRQAVVYLMGVVTAAGRDRAAGVGPPAAVQKWSGVHCIP